ncbi:MAG TPA: diguanylate cyclase [Aliidongia sp.]|nr:diguanylate cyclase [Aliidongia sp.]
MTSPELQRAKKAGTTAFALMEQRQISPTPQNYMVWYSYCYGANPGLKRALDILLSNGQEFTPELSADLHERFFGSDKQSESVRQISQRLEGSVRRALNMLSKAGDDARHYNETLGESAASLANSGEVTRAADIIRTVMQDTQEMLQRSDHLERQLDKSTAEIGELRKQIEDVSREALTDALTGIGNRKLFDQRLKQMMTDAIEEGTELGLLMLDIDYFKKFNDTYGHQLGDEVLRLVSRALVDGIKGRDLAARYGGEEFAILLPGTRLVDAARVAELLRASISTKDLIKRDTKEKLGSVTMSIGVSAFRLGEAAHLFIGRADAALYLAKQSGRNRVVTELDIANTRESPPRVKSAPAAS